MTSSELSDRPPARRWGSDRRGPLILLVSGALLLVVCAAVASADTVSRLEEAVFDAIFDLPNSLESVFKAAAYIGTIGLALLVIVVAWRTRQWLSAVLVVPAVIAAYLATYVVKELIERGRPEALLGITPREQMDVIARDGFPSGHMAVATTVALVLTYMLSPRWRAWVWLAPAAVGVSRIYMGEHMPIDILGGLAIGMVIGAAAELCKRWFQTARSPASGA